MKRYLCLLLAALMLLNLVACGETTEDPGVNETKADAIVSEVETADFNFTCDLPSNLNYNGEAISILYEDANHKADELISENLGLGVVSDAIYERNLAVQEMLNITFEYYPGDDANRVADSMTRDIQSGQGDYEIVVNSTYRSVLPAMEGKYINLSALENINTEKHYWTQGYNDIATFTDHDIQFLASGPIALSMFRCMFLTLYNKTLLDAYHIEDLYETVKNGDWTLDYQYSIVKNHYEDKDADTKASEGDFYGFVTGDTSSIDPYMVAANIHMIIEDADTGELMYNTDALTSLSDLCDKVQLLYNDESTYVYKTSEYDNFSANYIIEHFTDGNALMVTTMFHKMESNFESLAAMSYGIAPMPKFDTNQKDYHSYVQDQVSCFGISAVVDDIGRQEMLAAVLEAMAYYGYLLVRPAYYETTLSERYMQDPQSKEILDLLFTSLSFDFSSTCSDILGNESNIRNALRPLLSGEQNTIASSTKSWKKKVERSLMKHNETLNSILPE